MICIMSNFNIIIFLPVFYCTIKKELLQYRFINPQEPTDIGATKSIPPLVFKLALLLYSYSIFILIFILLPVSENTSFTVVIIGYEPPKLLSEDLMQSSSQEYEKK